MNSMLTFLTGTWFICYSDFPMWTIGDKHHPTCHYEIVSSSIDKSILSDEVSYIKKGKKKYIKGYDTQSPFDPNAFVWRGKGLLKLLSSSWKVTCRDEQNGQWAVIYFSKTLLTPAGVDVICREPSLPIETWDLIRLRMGENPLLAKHLLQIKHLS